MKVLLINPPYSGNINTWTPESTNRAIGAQPPLGLSYLAAALLRSGFKVEILDINALGLSQEQASVRIRRIDPDIVGITVMTLLAQNAIKVARLVKDTKSAAKVVLGGPHLSIFPKETLSFDCVDYAIFGEGEAVLPELIKRIRDAAPIEGLDGLVYKKQNEVIVNKAAIVRDLDALPMPALELLPRQSYSLANAAHPYSSIVTTRGCPWQCAFCLRDPVSVKLRFRSPALVVDEIERNIKDFGAREINICNDSLTAGRKHIEGICNEILKRKIRIRWQGPSRVNTVSPDLLKLMKRAGCHTLRYGVESGSQEILDKMCKGITIKQVEDAFIWTKQAGIEIMAYFMLGYLDETPQTMQKTINFAKKISPDGAIFAVATPLPQTELFRQAKDRGLVDPDYWRNFSLCKEQDRINYLVSDAEAWAKKALWSYYFRPSYIFRRLTKIRSWDALIKHLQGAWAFLDFHMYKRSGNKKVKRGRFCLKATETSPFSEER